MAWIAARYDGVLPREMHVGDGLRPGTGEYLNRPLRISLLYRIFVRAFTIDDVGLFHISTSTILHDVGLFHISTSTILHDVGLFHISTSTILH